MVTFAEATRREENNLLSTSRQENSYANKAYLPHAKDKFAKFRESF